jgi:hypothetical protein
LKFSVFSAILKKRKGKIDFKAKTISWKNKENFCFVEKIALRHIFPVLRKLLKLDLNETHVQIWILFLFAFSCDFFYEILCVESSFWFSFEFFELRGVFQGD